MDKITIGEATKIIEDMIRNGKMADTGIEKRHIDYNKYRLYDIEIMSNNKIRFKINRHPSITGASTIGRQSSNFIETMYQYEIDPNDWSISLIDEKILRVYEDIWGMAEDEIEQFFFDILPDDFLKEHYPKLTNITDEKEAEKYINNEVDKNSFDGWIFLMETSYESNDMQFTEDVKNEYLKAIRSKYKYRLFNIWRDYNEHKDDYDDE